jgi:Trk K+ transport system NAD-binding subunit
VVLRSDPRNVIGMLRRSDIVRAYSRAMLERLETQGQAHILPRELRGTQLVEVTIPPHHRLVGRHLASLKLPRSALVVAIQRGLQTIIPHGDTELLAGDGLTILVQKDAVVELHEYLATSHNGAQAPSLHPQGESNM